MTLGFAAKLALTLRSTNVCAYKINDSPLKTYNIVSAKFLLQNNLVKVRFLGETFLLADTKMELVLRMPFLFVSNANF